MKLVTDKKGKKKKRQNDVVIHAKERKTKKNVNSINPKKTIQEKVQKKTNDIGKSEAST